MKKLVLVMLLALTLQADNQNPRNADVPVLTMMMETRQGGEVSLKYPAYYWGPDPVANAEELTNLVTPQTAVLKTNVQLTLGRDSIDPGSYYMGFEITGEDEWQLVVSDESTEWMRVPIPVQRQANYVPFLSLVITPGVTDYDFLVNGLFGNYSVSMRWVISGVASRSADEAGPGLMSPLDEQTQPATAAVQQATPAQPAMPSATASAATESRQPPRVGSGAFRYYLDRNDNSEE